MDEIKTVEGVLTLDAAEEVGAAFLAGVTLDDGGGIDAGVWVRDIKCYSVEVCTYTWSLDALAVTWTLSRGKTPTIENRAPAGFQHLEQPQAWLCATLLFRETTTWLDAQRQRREPPAKLGSPLVMPLSIRGWREGAIVNVI